MKISDNRRRFPPACLTATNYIPSSIVTISAVHAPVSLALSNKTSNLCCCNRSDSRLFGVDRLDWPISYPKWLFFTAFCFCFPSRCEKKSFRLTDCKKVYCWKLCVNSSLCFNNVTLESVGFEMWRTCIAWELAWWKGYRCFSFA